MLLEKIYIIEQGELNKYTIRPKITTKVFQKKTKKECPENKKDIFIVRFPPFH